MSDNVIPLGDRPDPLQRLVRDRMDELGLTPRAAEERSAGMASQAVFNRIRHGSYRGVRLSERVLVGVSMALAVAEREVRAAAAASAACRPLTQDRAEGAEARLAAVIALCDATTVEAPHLAPSEVRIAALGAVEAEDPRARAWDEGFAAAEGQHYGGELPVNPYRR